MRASKLGIITKIPNSPQRLQCAKWLNLHFATESASRLALWDNYNIRCLPVLLTYRHSQEVGSIRVLILDSRWGTKPFKNNVVVQDQSWAVSQGLIPNPLTPNLPTTKHCLANFWGGQSQALPFRVRKFKFRRSKTASGSSSFLSICCLITLTTLFFRGRFNVLFIVCKDVPEGPSFGSTFQALQTGLNWCSHNLHRFLLKQLFNWMRYRQREGFLCSHRR